MSANRGLSATNVGPARRPPGPQHGMTSSPVVRARMAGQGSPAHRRASANRRRPAGGGGAAVRAGVRVVGREGKQAALPARVGWSACRHIIGNRVTVDDTPYSELRQYLKGVEGGVMKYRRPICGNI